MVWGGGWVVMCMAPCSLACLSTRGCCPPLMRPALLPRLQSLIMSSEHGAEGDQANGAAA